MNRLYATIGWLITLLIPLALIGLGVRILLTPLFPNIEYRLPDFPADEYGFTMQDRLHWGPYGINYLLNNADISYLGDLKFADGKPLFNEREFRNKPVPFLSSQRHPSVITYRHANDVREHEAGLRNHPGLHRRQGPHRMDRR